MPQVMGESHGGFRGHPIPRKTKTPTSRCWVSFILLLLLLLVFWVPVHFFLPGVCTRTHQEEIPGPAPRSQAAAPRDSERHRRMEQLRARFPQAGRRGIRLGDRRPGGLEGRQGAGGSRDTLRPVFFLNVGWRGVILRGIPKKWVRTNKN